MAKSLGIIYRVRKNLPKSVLITLYHALIHPYLEYCNTVWAIHRSSTLNDLFISKKKSLRAITFSNWNSHTAPLFRSLNILPLSNINDFHVCCYVYRSLNNLLPSHLSNMFVSNRCVHSYQTRNSQNLHIQQYRLSLRKHTVRNFGSHLWNSIPEYLRKLPTYSLFKKTLKAYLLQSSLN